MTVQTYIVVALSVIIIVTIISAIVTYSVKSDEYKKMIKLDVSIDKMREAEARIEQFYKENKLKKGTEILEVAKVFKVEKDKSFAFAHEVAHLLNGDEVPATRPSGRNKSEIEQLADYTAAALLMPLDAVYNCLEKKNYSKISVNKKTKVIRELCSEYRVSEVIVMRRIKEVYALKCR